MAVSVTDAIGLLGSVLTTVAFLQANIPGKEDPKGATVRIKAGLPPLGNPDGVDLGGSINNVYAFDERNGYGGESSGCDIDAGGICDVVVDQSKISSEGRRAGYISISNNNDATCIAWITVKQFDATFEGAWTGDIGRACDQAWYKSEEPTGHYKEEDGALKFDTGAYGEHISDTIGNDACAPTIFGSDNGQPGKGKRSPRDRPSWMIEALIVSNHTQHDAADLCNSATSWGPDFVGSDGMFCDMEAKVLTPLCKTEQVDGCVEIDDDTGILRKRLYVTRRPVEVVHKSYKKVQHWGH